MAFKGFAREEGFSTHQINLDIAAVINNDLAEANRQSKFMTRNAQLHEEWSNSYLTAMNQKHSVEAQNRRDNFQLFMENRKNIHEQHQKNKQVEFDDAGVDRHVPSLMDTLGPALLKMAVGVGSAAIGKAFKDENQRIAEAKQKELNTIRGFAAELSQNPEQHKLTQNPEFLKQIRSNVASEVKAATAKFNSMGKMRWGADYAQTLYRFHKLDIVDQQNMLHGEGVTFVAGQQHIQDWTTSINGSAPITFNEATSGKYSPETAELWLEKWGVAFREERGIFDVNAGAQHTANNAIRKIKAQVQGQISDNKYKQNLIAQETADVHYYENTVGNSVAKATAVLATKEEGGAGIGARLGRAPAWSWLLEHMSEYGSASDIRAIMAHRFGGLPSINDGAPSGGSAGTKKYQDWKAALAKAVNRGEVNRANTQGEVDEKLNSMTDSILSDPNISPRSAAVMLDGIKPGGPLHEPFIKASPDAQKRYKSALMTRAGYIAEQPIISPGRDWAQNHVKAKHAVAVAKSFIRDENNQRIPLDGLPKEEMTKLEARFFDTYRNWAGDVAEELIKSGVVSPDDPIEITEQINAIVAENDPRVRPLQEMLEARVLDPTDPDRQRRLRVPEFPNMMKPAGQGEKGFVESYNAERIAAFNKGLTLGYEDITSWNHPEIESFMKLVSKAKKDKHIDLNDILSNPNEAVRRIIQTQEYSSAGQVYMAGLEYGRGYADKYERLSESDYMDYNEVRQQYDTFGAEFAELSNNTKAATTAQYLANGNQFTPNAATVRSASGYVGSTNVVNTGFKDYKGRNIMLSPQAAVSWQAMIDAGMPFSPSDVHSVYRDEAEWDRLRSQGINASATGAHNIGEAADVHGLTGAWIKEYGHEFGWGPEDSSYGHGSHGGHFRFKGYSPPQQQQTQLPLNTTDKYVAKEHKPGEPLTEEGVPNPDRGADVRVTNGGIQFWFTADGKLNTMAPTGEIKRDVDIRMLEVLEADEKQRGLW